MIDAERGSFYLMKAPEHLEWALRLGYAVVSGSMVRDVETGQVLGNLEPTGKMLAKVSSLTTAGGAVGGPVGAFAGALVAVADLGSSLFANFQLQQIKDTLATIEKLSQVAALASVANLGVSVSGFIYIAKRLDGIEGRLEAVEAKIDTAAWRDSASVQSRLTTSLERIEEGFVEVSSSAQTKLWSLAEQNLHELINYYLTLLESTGAEPVYAALTPELAAELLAGVTEAGRARVRALLLLGRKEQAANTARLLSVRLKQFGATEREVFDTLRGGRPLSAPLVESILELSKGYSKLTHQIVTDFEDISHTVNVMIKRHVDSLRYIIEAREHEEQTFLFFPQHEELLTELERAHAKAIT